MMPSKIVQSMTKDKKNTSQHILSTSSNLLGICFIVLTSLKLLKMQSDTLVDEFTASAMILFMISCILSFLSLKSNGRWVSLYESVAEVRFLTGLICLFGTTMLITFNII
ncbi:MAG: hypothetical protein WKI04_18470 [Ferruginibacter sp.]